MDETASAELAEQSSELFVLCAALYFKRVGGDANAVTLKPDDTLHRTAQCLIALGETNGREAQQESNQFQRGMKQLAEGLLETSFMVQRRGDSSTAEILEELAETIAAELTE